MHGMEQGNEESSRGRNSRLDRSRDTSSRSTHDEQSKRAETGMYKECSTGVNDVRLGTSAEWRRDRQQSIYMRL